MIGYIFRNQEEYDACFEVKQTLMQVLDGHRAYLPDDYYLNHPDWQNVVSLAKKAVRTLHAE